MHSEKLTNSLCMERKKGVSIYSIPFISYVKLMLLASFICLIFFRFLSHQEVFIIMNGGEIFEREKFGMALKINERTNVEKKNILSVRINSKNY